jgi:hypothetical protein
VNLIEHEAPLKPPFPDVAHWSENFCLAGHDPKSEIGFWLHLGRWRKDLTQWRETIVINMPDGTVVAHRSYGNALTSEEGPGGTNYCIRIIEGGRKLSYRFEGAARHVPAASLRSGLLVDGPQERLSFDLVFESTADIWDLHKVGGTQKFLGTGHIEQIGRIRGDIRIDERVFPFAGMGNRDHSMGPRDTPTLKSHQWLQGYFDNGISFLIYDAVLRDQLKPVFCEAVVYEGDKLFAGKLSYDWRVDGVADAAKNYGFAIEYPNGKLDIRTTTFTSTAYLSFTVPNDIYIGVFPAGDPPLTLLEQSTTLTLNDSVKGYGNFERTVPGHIALDH